MARNASGATRGRNKALPARARNQPGRAGSAAVRLAPPAAVPPDATLPLLDAPARMAAVWTQFAEQMQRAGQQTWQGLQHDAELESEALEHAGSPQQLAGAPAELAAEQAARWAQWSTQLTASLLDVQAAWFKNLESVTAQWLSPWLTQNGRIAFGSAQDLVEPPLQAGPAPLLWAAQRWWSESAKAMLQAVVHDVQGAATR